MLLPFDARVREEERQVMEDRALVFSCEKMRIRLVRYRTKLRGIAKR
jgi:hypothetical protein